MRLKPLRDALLGKFLLGVDVVQPGGGLAFRLLHRASLALLRLLELVDGEPFVEFVERVVRLLACGQFVELISLVGLRLLLLLLLLHLVGRGVAGVGVRFVAAARARLAALGVADPAHVHRGPVAGNLRGRVVRDLHKVADAGLEVAADLAPIQGEHISEDAPQPVDRREQRRDSPRNDRDCQVERGEYRDDFANGVDQPLDRVPHRTDRRGTVVLQHVGQLFDDRNERLPDRDPKRFDDALGLGNGVLIGNGAFHSVLRHDDPERLGSFHAVAHRVIVEAEQLGEVARAASEQVDRNGVPVVSGLHLAQPVDAVLHDVIKVQMLARRIPGCDAIGVNRVLVRFHLTA